MIQLVSTCFDEKMLLLNMNCSIASMKLFLSFFFNRRRAVLHSTYRGKIVMKLIPVQPFYGE